MEELAIRTSKNLAVQAPRRSHLLQRACACGQHTSGGGCESCRKKRLMRMPVGERKQAERIPPIVPEVLRSPGRPLGAGTRRFMEPRFGHDFSQVRVHTGVRAAESVRAVDALAYTVDRHVVFGAGQYRPEVPGGQRLLAHELAHVVQQSRAGQPVMMDRLSIDRPDSPLERQAEGAVDQALADDGPVKVSPKGHAHLQRLPLGVGGDPIHDPLIEQFRREHGLPPGGVDEFGKRVGPSDAEIKYLILPFKGLPLCPDVETFEKGGDFRDPEKRKAFSDANCISSESQAMPPACRFSPKQEKILASAQKEAAARVQRGLDRIGAGAEGRNFAREMAGRLFDSEPPTVKEVIARLKPVQNFLKGSGVQFAGRTCGDAECQRGPVAYVTGPGQLPIYICPTAFSHPDELHRTVLHEALHWSGLDADPATPEGYCSKFDCVTPCLTKEVADAWTHYLDCLGQPLEMRRSFREKILESVHEIP